MLVFLLTNPMVRKFGPYIIAALAALVAYAWITTAAYDRGVEATIVVYEEAMDAEIERIDEANETAQAAARLNEGELRTRLRIREDAYQRLLSQAGNDPNAGRACLGVDSVRRLNDLGG